MGNGSEVHGGAGGRSLGLTESSVYCRGRGLFPDRVVRYREATHDANLNPVHTFKD